MTELRLRRVSKHFPVRGGLLGRTVGQTKAVDGVSLSVVAGEALGVVGESGCGKSTTGRLATRLIDPTSGSVHLDGQDVTRLSGRDLMHFRRQVQIVFQDPQASLNPRHTVATILGTALRAHAVVPPEHERARIGELLERVGLNPEHMNRYPNEFSGGQRQRIGIARALAVEPAIIVADEPVSALDVSIQAQVMNLLSDLRTRHGIGFLFIAHDLDVVRHFCDRIAVMYLGRVVELGSSEAVGHRPQHPYSQALLSAVPRMSLVGGGARRSRIRLQGDPPSPTDPPSGCRFRTRCWRAEEVCAEQTPKLRRVPTGQSVACHFPGD